MWWIIQNRLRYFGIEAGQEVHAGFKPIAEIPGFSYTYVSCSKTETGKRWIKDIDAALTDLKAEPRVQKCDVSLVFRAGAATTGTTLHRISANPAFCTRAG